MNRKWTERTKPTETTANGKQTKTAKGNKPKQLSERKETQRKYMSRYEATKTNEHTEYAKRNEKNTKRKNKESEWMNESINELMN